MKKVTKATIAAAAAGALLLGGAGTVALWQGTDTVNSGNVQTGHLKLDTTATGQWTDISGGSSAPIADIAAFKIVPGDTVQFVQTVTIDAVGNNLKGALSVGALDAAIPAELADDVTANLAIDPENTSGLTKAGNVLSFGASGTYQVPITITVAFEAGTTGSTAAVTMDKQVVLSALSLNLDQVRP